MLCLLRIMCLSCAFFFRKLVGNHSKRDCNKDRILGWDVSLNDFPVLEHIPVNLHYSGNDVVNNVDSAVRLLPNNPEGSYNTSYHVSAVVVENFVLAANPRKRWILKDFLSSHDCLNVGCQEHYRPKNVPS